MTSANGGCLCGNVRYSVHSEPIFVIKCFCTFCQRSTGSNYLVETLFPINDLLVIKGQSKIYEHVSDGSGKLVHVNFCADCGTKVFQTFDRFPDKVGVFNGTFDDPDWYKRTSENTRYFFLKEARDGAMISAGYDVYDGHFWESDGVESVAQNFDEHVLVSDTTRRKSAEFAAVHRKTSDK